jgi:histidine triad (HIT) family protein
MACVFCDIVAGRTEAAIVAETAECLAFLDIRPLFPGHTLVTPREHHETLADLPQVLLEPLFGLVQRLSAAIPRALGAQGTFVANNNIVSQSVPHLHVHVVPRTRRDGLRGFFWPRRPYESDAQREEVRGRVARALAELP